MTLLFKPSLYRMWAVLLAMCSFILIQGSNVTTPRRHQSTNIRIPHTSDPSPQRDKILKQENKSWIPEGFLSLWEKSRAATDVSDGYHHYNTPQNIRRRTDKYTMKSQLAEETSVVASSRRFLSHKQQIHRVPPIGWIPTAYPSPLENPDQCRISSVSVPDSDLQNGGEANTNTPNSSILLCDPDGVLSIPQLNTTSSVLQNFTHHYGRGSSSRKKRHELEQDQGQGQEQENEIEIAVAIVSKMDLPDILRDFAFYTFEDEDDMIHDAAQYFADYLHNKWFSSEEDTANGDSRGSTTDSEAGAFIANGILIFISAEDFVCFISAGNGVTAVLPWWRLLRVVDRMTESMHYHNYFDAVIGAIHDISSMLDEGPPSMSERFGDFLNRFGAVLFFTSTTIILAICGEYRDQQKRYDDAEILSAMDEVEEQKAMILQSKFKTDECPICLEPIDHVIDDDEDFMSSHGLESHGLRRPSTRSEEGNVKMLRCGHIFHYPCWKCWIMNGTNGDPGLCPVCRQHIANKKKRGSLSSNGSDDSELAVNTTPLINDRTGRDTYGSSDNVIANNNLLYYPTRTIPR